MAELLRMPEVAAGATSAVLSQWPLTVGSSFSTGDVIAIIETDKAVVDVEAEADGTLVHIVAADGQEVAIGDPIALIAGPGETVDDVDATLASLGVTGGEAAPAPACDTPSGQPAESTAQAPVEPSPQPPSPRGLRYPTVGSSPAPLRAGWPRKPAWPLSKSQVRDPTDESGVAMSRLLSPRGQRLRQPGQQQHRHRRQPVQQPNSSTHRTAVFAR